MRKVTSKVFVTNYDDLGNEFNTIIDIDSVNDVCRCLHTESGIYITLADTSENREMAYKWYLGFTLVDNSLLAVNIAPEQICGIEFRYEKVFDKELEIIDTGI